MVISSKDKMKINKNNDNFELDYYIKIIDNFKNTKVNQEVIEIWKDKSLIDLMKLLELTKNDAMVSNAIILILSLLDDIPPDLYNNRGVNSNQIPDKDKKYLIDQLKNEFLPN
ncbi:hypothetical protein LCGC14_1077210 [marine sediment metagenome]|uniref:Uncharacterized protein n=1 Tax=marine sediment metagenome TaxID=412755 RepID=A0A0F9MGE5_9ZZZZ